jgi:hypothetical protein
MAGLYFVVPNLTLTPIYHFGKSCEIDRGLIMYRKIVFVLAMALSTGNTYAAVNNCTGKIDKIYQTVQGGVAFESMAMFGDSEARAICNLNYEWNGASIAVCRGWLSKMLAAKSRSSELTVQYNDDNVSCASQPVWYDASSPWAIW